MQIHTQPTPSSYQVNHIFSMLSTALLRTVQEQLCAARLRSVFNTSRLRGVGQGCRYATTIVLAICMFAVRRLKECACFINIFAWSDSLRVYCTTAQQNRHHSATASPKTCNFQQSQIIYHGLVHGLVCKPDLPFPRKQGPIPWRFAHLTVIDLPYVLGIKELKSSFCELKIRESDGC